MKKLLFLACILPLIGSCDYDSEDQLYGTELCGTDAISYADIIEPIINSNCASCHSGASPSAGLRLDDYDLVRASTQNAGSKSLVNRIERAEGSAGAMPTNYRLAQCEIDQINAWIEQGGLNN
tara:strand:+ start:777 stop:1145 length:369 start_codon:yes stop_codon:yes gene_type:complete